MKSHRRLLLFVGLLLPAPLASAATVLFCPFDSLEGWSVRSVGPARISVGPSSAAGMCCAEIASQGGTAFLTRPLPLEAVRGRRVTLGCLAKCADVVRGPQLASTAKIHLAVRTPRGVQHHYARLLGTADWHREGFFVDIPDDAEQAVLNLGLESCQGRAWFGRLLVRNDRQGVYPLTLATVANAEHGQLGLDVFPSGTLHWQDLPFEILNAAAGQGADCLRLRGSEHPDWPARTASTIEAHTPATTIYILHGALNGRPRNESPCAIWTARFADGQETTLSVFEGRDIGPIGAEDDLENWRVAWRQQDTQGRWVSFGVTKWTLHCDEPVLSLSCQAYQGASPVVLAVTVVEAPPMPQQPMMDDETEDER